nr:retrovirus-related Pol polyprotein from transposon TNT 1-94 [Tanacetum cinerariifolium]
MLADSLLPTTFWAEVVNTAFYVQNKVLVTKPHNKTPYELLIGRSSNLEFMRPFGCHVTILNTLHHLGKFDGKDDERFLVGYSVNSKTFRVFNYRTRKVEENLHVNFLQNKPNVAGNIHAGQASQEKAVVHEYILLPFIPSNPPLSLTIQSSDVNAGDIPGDVNGGDIQGDVGEISRNDDVCQGKEIRIDSSTQAVNAANPSLQVKQKQDEIFINQDKYVAEILKKFGFSKCKKQTVVAHSTTKAEYIATSRCFGQVKKVNDEVRIQALVDGKRVNIKESSIRRTLRLDDAEGTSCLTNAEIFEGLARMGYETSFDKLTFYKAFFSPQWKFLIHIILQCLSAKTTSWNEFSSTMASAIICLATNQKFNFQGDLTHHKDIFASPSLINNFFANMKRVGTGFSREVTLLFDNMLVQAPEEVDFDDIINRKRENRKWLNKALDERPYQFQMLVPSDSTVAKLQTAEDLHGDALLHYEAEIELMNLILLSIPNDIFNSVDACTSAKDIWKRVELDTFDDLFDYLQQFEKVVNTSRAKKLEKSHDLLALVAHTGSSSRNTSSYYVTHPTSVVDYNGEYQQDDIQTNSEDPLTSAMLLLARAVTQNFSNPTNNRLRTSSNTKNQAVIQCDREVVEGSNETSNVQRTLQNSSLGNTSTVQCYNCSGKGHYARNCPKPRVRDSKYFMEQMLVAKQDEAGVILIDEQNDFLYADASRMEKIEDLKFNQPITLLMLGQAMILLSTIGDDQIDSNIIFNTPNRNVNSGSVEKDTHVLDLYALEQLARNAYQEAEKQQIFAQKNNNYLNEFLEADQRAKHFDQQAQSQFIRDRDIIRDLEKQRDKLELVFNDYKRKNEEFQESHLILKRQMSEKEDSYHDTIIDLKEKLKKNVDLILKLENSLQEMFMLGPNPLSVYDQQLTHGLGYSNPFTLKQEIAQCPKLYLASSLGNSEIPLNIKDNEDTLDDASKKPTKNERKNE